MKLAFCLFNFFPYGGLQRDFLRIARACAKRGHEIHVYTMQWEGELEPSFHIHLIKIKGMQNHVRAEQFAKKVHRLLKETPHDLIIGFNKMPGLDVYYAADVCYQSRIRKQRSLWYRLLPRYRRYKKLEEAVFAEGASTQVLLISPHQQQEYTACYRTESSRFNHLPPGIAKDRIAPVNAAQIRAEVRDAHELTDDHLLLLAVGSGFKTKGLDRSLYAIAALPQSLRIRCKLFVLGDDQAKPFQQLAEQLNIGPHIHFFGGCDNVPDYLLAADLLLHPAYHENTGTVLLEALVAGLPVLTVDVCGYAHYITKAQAGEVLPAPFQQSRMNDTLEQILLSDAKRKEWQQNALQYSRQADLYSLPDKAVDLIESWARK